MVGNKHGPSCSTIVAFNKITRLGDAVEEDEDDDIIETDIPAASARGKERWLAVALHYTKQRYSRKHLFEDMSIAWGLQVLVKVRDLENNRFLLSLTQREP